MAANVVNEIESHLTATEAELKWVEANLKGVWQTSLREKLILNRINLKRIYRVGRTNLLAAVVGESLTGKSGSDNEKYRAKEDYRNRDSYLSKAKEADSMSRKYKDMAAEALTHI